MNLNYQNEVLTQYIQDHLGDLDEETTAMLQEHLQWRIIRAGHTLIQQGDQGDSMFLVVTGRLRAYICDPDGKERLVREIARGEIVGELSLYTAEPRSATVRAIRDTAVVQLDKSSFDKLIKSYPQISILLTRKIVERFQSQQIGTGFAKPIVVGLIPVSEGLDHLAFAHQLATHFVNATIVVVDALKLDRETKQTGLAHAELDNTEADRRIGLYLDQLESTYDHVLLVGDTTATNWNQRCLRRSDEILLLAVATRSPNLHATEVQHLQSQSVRSEIIETLVLLYPKDTPCPNRSAMWIDRRFVNSHLNIRPSVDKDLDRLARYITHTSVGLVLAGGGASGLAHLGIYRALRERGIEVDYVGGTSIGAVVSALIASDRSEKEITQIARRAFMANPTKDLSFIPLLSLLSGRRLKSILRSAIQETFGFQPTIEDMWKNFYCVASNYTQVREQLIVSGALKKGIMASLAIPGVLPPVLDKGDLLCDGGTFNNFPVNIMRGIRSVNKVIGVDLNSAPRHKSKSETFPSNWVLLLDRLRPYRQQRFRFPSLVTYLVNVSVLYSHSRKEASRGLTDLYFNPPLKRIDMLAWKRFDSIVEQGYQHALGVLDAMPAEQLQSYIGKTKS